jgi:hypothetical protein
MTRLGMTVGLIQIAALLGALAAKVAWAAVRLG